MNILRLKSAVLWIVLLAVGFVQAATAQNFTFTIEPDSLTLVPGQSASFVVDLTALDGFTNQVTLSVSNLPSGVTSSFQPQMLTPPGTSLLTLDATTNAANGSFDLGLIAVGGGITNSTSSKVSVSFGLLPLCYGAFQGLVTDITTGLPVPYAEVVAGNEFYATANASGQYVITNVTLGSSENLPLDYSITASRSNYWPSTTTAYAVCDATNIVNFQILTTNTGSISGTLTAQGGQPLTNQTVTAYAYLYTFYYYEFYASTNTDSNGFFQFPSLPLETGNAPAYYEVYSQPAGYWEASTNTIVAANSNSVVNLVATNICYATVTGSVVYSNTGLPATNLSVYVYTSAGLYATTDSNGNFTLTNVTLGADNAAVTGDVSVSASGYYGTYVYFGLSNCNQNLNVGTLSLAPIPPPPTVTNNYGTLTGHVYDVQTLLVITNASLYAYAYSENYATTDSNGVYLITNILVGTDTETNYPVSLDGYATGYFEGYTNVEVYSGLTSTQDIYLLRIAYGAVEGTVLDSATGLPVSGVYVSIANSNTGANGHYASPLLQLESGNAPTYESFYASETGYWTIYTNTTISNGVTNVVNIDIIKVCTGATIVGNVINALTVQPITNATLTIDSYPTYEEVMTDSNGNFILTNITVGNNNSPSAVTVYATAPGFNPQNKTVTIFCGAVITTEFGAPETAFGAIDGYVTNVLTGQPLTNVFIGSGFGASTYTDTNGYYILTQAPLGAQGANRTWTVTAAPSAPYDFPSQTKSVVVSSNMTNQLDFGFGLPLTTLMVSATGAPNPDTVGSNVLYTITLTNSVADAEDVLLTDTLPPGVTFVNASFSNNPGGEFGAPMQTNGIVTIMATNFTSNSAVVLLITVTPTVTGILTNMAGVSSFNISPADTNLTATVTNLVVETLYADVGVSMTGVPNPVLVSNQLTYTIYVTNFGPANAPGVVLTDSLPADVTFWSASVSQGGYSLITNGLEWSIGALSNQGFASATVVILPLQTGLITNTATVSISPASPSVTDTNLANNTTNVVTTVTASVLTNVSLLYGPINFNPQTGLYQQTVQFNNLGGVTAAAVRVAVLDLSSVAVLYNATGTTNGVPYVEYDQPVPGGSNVVFLLEYYDSTRKSFVSTNFVATVVAAAVVAPPIGTILQLDRPAFLNEGQLTIEFASVPGHTYVVQYSSDMLTWQTATPPILAANTSTQWIDAGPPSTASLPGSPGQRFYRIVQTN